MILRYLLKDKTLISLFAASLALDFFAWFLLWWQVAPKEGAFFLHYTVYFGVDWVGEWYKIFLTPLAGFVFFCLNAVLAAVFYKSEKLISYFFAFGTALLEIFIVLQSIFLIIMNT